MDEVFELCEQYKLYGFPDEDLVIAEFRNPTEAMQYLTLNHDDVFTVYLAEDCCGQILFVVDEE